MDVRANSRTRDHSLGPRNVGLADVFSVFGQSSTCGTGVAMREITSFSLRFTAEDGGASSAQFLSLSTEVTQ
jgi:hypothetical protein